MHYIHNTRENIFQLKNLIKLNNYTRQNNRLDCIKVIISIELLNIVPLVVLNKMTFNSFIELFYFIEVSHYILKIKYYKNSSKLNGKENIDAATSNLKKKNNV